MSTEPQAETASATFAAGWAAFRADLDRAYQIHWHTTRPSLRERALLWATHHGLHCVAAYRLHRLARRLQRRHRLAALPLLTAARTLTYAMGLLHHVEIFAEVGPGLYIGHASSIYIGPTRIGRDFTTTHNVTIGMGPGQGGRALPVIGDGVWVGTGSVLSGGIKVGDGVAVAHGTMVNTSVPERCLVGGNPGRVVLRDYDNRELLGRGPAPRADPAPRPDDDRAAG